MTIEVELNGDLEHFAFNHPDDFELSGDEGLEYCLSNLLEYYHELFTTSACIGGGPMQQVLGEDISNEIENNLEKSIKRVKSLFGEMLIEYLGCMMPSDSENTEINIKFKFKNDERCEEK